jgi:hypothetical protein
VSLERLAQDANGDRIYRFTRPWSDGTTGIKLAPLELIEKLAALVPLPRAHLVRYAGCLAPHSKLRTAIIPTPRQQGIDGNASTTGTPYWDWAKLLGRIVALDMATCPFCRRGFLRDCVGAGQLCCPSLHIIAAITRASVMTRILRHLQLASVLPPLRGRREPCNLSPSYRPGPPPPRAIRVQRNPRQRGSIGDVRAAAVAFASFRPV